MHKRFLVCHVRTVFQNLIMCLSQTRQLKCCPPSLLISKLSEYSFRDLVIVVTCVVNGYLYSLV